MNKQKLKKMLKYQQRIIVFLIFVIGFGFGIAFANFTKIQISAQSADNNSHKDYIIDIKNETTSSSGAYYVNNRNNSAIIGNYFEGYYYDSLYGWFKLNWSNNQNENVRIINGTDKCSTGYGYNLGGKAKSEYGGYIDFSGVYYCLSDGKLHGKGYSKYLGYQDFEGIDFEIITKGEADIIKQSDNNFLNDNNTVEKTETLKGNETKTSNAGTFKIGGNKFYLDDIKESIFYIIK